jgi:hypothetical protein
MKPDFLGTGKNGKRPKRQRFQNLVPEKKLPKKEGHAVQLY